MSGKKNEQKIYLFGEISLEKRDEKHDCGHCTWSSVTHTIYPQYLLCVLKKYTVLLSELMKNKNN